MNARGEAARYVAAGALSAAASFLAMHAVNLLFFGGTAHPGRSGAAVLGIANWTAGMLAAYVLNRKWVFRSCGPVRKEFPRFLASRAATLLVDQALRQALLTAGIGVYAASVAVLCIVTALNYAAGKAAVFRGSRQK